MAEERRAMLEAELEDIEGKVQDALAFINDDRHLTDEGLAAREGLRGQLEAIRQNLEVIRQEHVLAPEPGFLDEV
jgi:uncharacterized protein YjbJ (UPF0337 family)